MQIDMHYYGTYAMARAAGLNREASTVIATAAQFVDDNADKENVWFRDGARIDGNATAHHAFDYLLALWFFRHKLPKEQGC